MVKRQIIQVDEDKCNGCGVCVPNCYEGALQIIDNKARLISDLFCDGLGNCIGHCPQDAITIIEREAESYNEKKVMEKIVSQGENTVKAHLKHLQDHNETEFLKQAYEYLDEQGIKIEIEPKQEFKGCPGSKIIQIETHQESSQDSNSNEQNSQLKQWPLQIKLLPSSAPFFRNAHLSIIADCAGFANPNLHENQIKNKAIAIGCPKFDGDYTEKIKQIIEFNNLKSIDVGIMEVPCCAGLYHAVKQALQETGKQIPLTKTIIHIDGKVTKNEAI